MVAGRAWLRATLGLLTGAFFIVLVVGLAPHLVHHLFDSHQTHVECPFAAVAERQHAVPTVTVTVVTATVSVSLPPLPTSNVPSTTRAAASARAPPAAAS